MKYNFTVSSNTDTNTDTNTGTNTVTNADTNTGTNTDHESINMALMHHQREANCQG